MMTTVILAGAMGKKFGRKWELEVSSPAEALRMIEVNVAGFAKWINENVRKYPNYRVSCLTEKFEEDISEEQLLMRGRYKKITIVPLVEGSGGAARIIIGAAMMFAGALMTLYHIPGGEFVFNAGIAMAIGGVVELLSPGVNKSKRDSYEKKDKTSYYFNGPVNTQEQGVPVPLIYGRVLTGSHPISVSVMVDSGQIAYGMVPAGNPTVAQSA